MILCPKIKLVLQGTIQIFAGTENILLNTGDIEIINLNEILGIVGGSECGKSTLVNTLLLLHEATDEEVFLMKNPFLN